MKFDFKRIIRYFDYRAAAGAPINVLRDWKVVFFSFVFLSLLFSLADAVLFLKYRSEMNSGAAVELSQEDRAVTLNRKLLTSVLRELKEKEDRFGKKLSAPPMKDPSR